jgi:hypothetical protein
MLMTSGNTRTSTGQHVYESLTSEYQTVEPTHLKMASNAFTRRAYCCRRDHHLKQACHDFFETMPEPTVSSGPCPIFSLSSIKMSSLLPVLSVSVTYCSAFPALIRFVVHVEPGEICPATLPFALPRLLSQPCQFVCVIFRMVVVILLYSSGVFTVAVRPQRPFPSVRWQEGTFWTPQPIEVIFMQVTRESPLIDSLYQTSPVLSHCTLILGRWEGCNAKPC